MSQARAQMRSKKVAFLLVAVAIAVAIAVAVVVLVAAVDVMIPSRPWTRGPIAAVVVGVGAAVLIERVVEGTNGYCSR